MLARTFLVILAAITAALAFPGTEESAAQDCDLVNQDGDCVSECDFDEYELDGECLPECPEGYEPDDVLGTCELEDDSSSVADQQPAAAPSSGKVTMDAISNIREGQTFLVSGKVQDRSGQGIAGAPYKIVLTTKSHDVVSKNGTTLAGGKFSEEFKAPDVNGKQRFLAYVSTPYGLGSRIFDVNESGCLIATAAFGSELAPQVQFLREFRDQRILSTASGTSFMDAFNTVYYSFSPQVADYERDQPWLQAAVRAGIQPLLGILAVSEKAYSL
ncbi:MAG: furin-like repeat-containing protein, partial [Nitrososphaera sp.]